MESSAIRRFASALLGRSSDHRRVGQADYFPTQRVENQSRSTITEVDKKYGAPLGPIPRSFLRIPPELMVCNPLASADEIAAASTCRRSFLIDGYERPYMLDIIRAFRMLCNKRIYVEVGTFDRGNLAYVSRLLADDALLIGVDVQAEEIRDVRLKQVIKPNQRYISVIGDSRAPETVSAVAAALDGRRADAVFIDGGHTAHAVLCDYVNYGVLVAHNGLVMFHDSLWEGTDVYKGSADALAEIDKLDPIYLVTGEGPAHRFMRTMWRDEIWGVVGIHITA